MNKTTIKELPIENCKSKAEFVKRYLSPLIKAVEPSVLSVEYDYNIHGDIAIEEYIEVQFRGGSFLNINVSRNGNFQLVLDTISAIQKGAN